MAYEMRDAFFACNVCDTRSLYCFQNPGGYCETCHAEAGAPVEFIGRYLFDSIGNEHEITGVQPSGLELESVSGPYCSTVTLAHLIAHEDDSEGRDALDADERLTCHTHKQWATEAHIATHSVI